MAARSLRQLLCQQMEQLSVREKGLAEYFTTVYSSGPRPRAVSKAQKSDLSTGKGATSQRAKAPAEAEDVHLQFSSVVQETPGTRQSSPVPAKEPEGTWSSPVKPLPLRAQDGTHAVPSTRRILKQQQPTEGKPEVQTARPGSSRAPHSDGNATLYERLGGAGVLSTVVTQLSLSHSVAPGTVTDARVRYFLKRLLTLAFSRCAPPPPESSSSEAPETMRFQATPRSQTRRIAGMPHVSLPSLKVTYRHLISEGWLNPTCIENLPLGVSEVLKGLDPPINQLPERRQSLITEAYAAVQCLGDEIIAAQDSGGYFSPPEEEVPKQPQLPSQSRRESQRISTGATPPSARTGSKVPGKESKGSSKEPNLLQLFDSVAGSPKAAPGTAPPSKRNSHSTTELSMHFKTPAKADPSQSIQNPPVRRSLANKTPAPAEARQEKASSTAGNPVPASQPASSSHGCRKTTYLRGKRSLEVEPEQPHRTRRTRDRRRSTSQIPLRRSLSGLALRPATRLKADMGDGGPTVAPVEALATEVVPVRLPEVEAVVREEVVAQGALEKLELLEPWSEEYRLVETLWQKTGPKGFTLAKVEKVVHPSLLARFAAGHAYESSLEVANMLWHGSKDPMGVVSTGFRIAGFSRDNSVWFHNEASYAFIYNGSVLLLAAVRPGMSYADGRHQCFAETDMYPAYLVGYRIASSTSQLNASDATGP
eukprot:RCo020382